MAKSLTLRFETLRDWLSLARDKRSTGQTLRRFAQSQGFEWFTYLSVHETDVHGLSNYPEQWQRHYLDSRLAEVDPVVEAISLRRGAYAWSENGLPVRPRRCHRKFFGEARGFGIRSGISIPIFDGFGRRALFTFSSSEPKPDTTMLADQYSVLTLGAFVDAHLRTVDDGNFMRAVPCPLTRLQLECLAWLAHGKTNDDIAVLRGVSRRAVEFQIQSIRHKLNAVTTCQAVGVAVKRKWI